MSITRKLPHRQEQSIIEGGSCELLVTNIETTEGYLSPPRGICMEHQDSPPPYSSKIVGYSTVYFAQNFLGCNEEIEYNEETQFLVLQWP